MEKTYLAKQSLSEGDDGIVENIETGGQRTFTGAKMFADMRGMDANLGDEQL